MWKSTRQPAGQMFRPHNANFEAEKLLIFLTEKF